MSIDISPHTRTTSKLTRDAGTTVVDALQDRNVIEIFLNPDGQLWVDCLSAGLIPLGTMSSSSAMSFIATVASTLETIVNRDNPIIEGELEIDGSRFEGLTPPVVERPVFAIRKKAPRVFSLDDYVQQGTLSEAYRGAIEDAVLNRKNILISGGTGSGKTTLTNAILLAITQSCPDHRVIVIEDTIELQCRAKNSVALRTSPTVTMQDLLRATMRLRPDRIVVGEVRGGEALTLVKAWNTGHPGGVATCHANSVRGALRRIEQLVAEASPSYMQEVIAEAIDLIIHIERDETSSERRISEVCSLTGFVNGEYCLTPIKGEF
jgi:P-type conjugative transfer ATPase TrbB